MLVFSLAVLLTVSQTSFAQDNASDPQALNMAGKSILSMTGMTVISDVVINATVTSFQGSDRSSGLATVKLNSKGESRIDSILDGQKRTDVQSNGLGFPQKWWLDSNGTHAAASHNSMTDSAWLFPALSSLASVSEKNVILSYLGQETKDGVQVEHLRTYKVWPEAPREFMTFKKLTMTDYFLDAETLLPVAMIFNLHPDDDMSRDIPVEVQFKNYVQLAGVFMPKLVRRLSGGELASEFVITAVTINGGLDPGDFK